MLAKIRFIAAALLVVLPRWNILQPLPWDSKQAQSYSVGTAT